MGIRVSWHSKTHSILKWRFEGFFNIQNYYNALSLSHRLLEGHHSVCFLIDLTDADINPVDLLRTMSQLCYELRNYQAHLLIYGGKKIDLKVIKAIQSLPFEYGRLKIVEDEVKATEILNHNFPALN